MHFTRTPHYLAVIILDQKTDFFKSSSNNFGSEEAIAGNNLGTKKKVGAIYKNTICFLLDFPGSNLGSEEVQMHFARIPRTIR